MRKEKQIISIGTLLALSFPSLSPGGAHAETSPRPSAEARPNTKSIVRAPAGINKKPMIIHRRKMKPERRFEFSEEGLLIPSEPAAFDPPTPRSAAPETRVQIAPEKSFPIREAPLLPNATGMTEKQASLSPEVPRQMGTPGPQKPSTESYTPEELQLFEAFVHLENRRAYLAALGAFAPLMASSSKSLQTAARWGYAHAALGLGLRLQYELTLMDFLDQGEKAWTSRAFESLVKHSDPEQSVWVQMLSEKQFDRPPSTAASDAYLLLRSYRLTALQKVKDALENLRLIPAESALFGWRAYHEALLTYRQGQAREAQALLEQALASTPQAFKANDLRAKTQILLGRLAFQNRDFNKAFSAYRSIPQNNPLWPEGMMEQALSQILFEDFEGAAGNMFSLHTDFFKKSYSPESYLIRSVGYLNLCQYADALKVTQDLQRKYKPILASLENYSQKTTPEQDFATIREFARHPDLRELHGLVRPLLFAWTQDPEFGRHQSRINQIEDEIEAFRKLSLQIVKQERELSRQFTEASQAVREALQSKSSTARVDSLKLKLEGLRSETRMLQTARKSLAKLRPEITAELEAMKTERKALALKALVQRRQLLQANLQQVLDQSDVLMYEIYNGAGDHLRFQAAGGEIEARRTAALTSADAVNWKYKGEVWEDELGHYRSSLNNVCAKDLSLHNETTKEGQ